jgi:DNA-binding Lrp family transcriptional regulator
LDVVFWIPENRCLYGLCALKDPSKTRADLSSDLFLANNDELSRLKVLVGIVVEPKLLEEVCQKLSELEAVTQVYTVTGEYDVFIITEAPSVDAFRELLKENVLSVPGVKLTESSVVLGVWKE